MRVGRFCLVYFDFQSWWERGPGDYFFYEPSASFGIVAGSFGFACFFCFSLSFEFASLHFSIFNK